MISASAYHVQGESIYKTQKKKCIHYILHNDKMLIRSNFKSELELIITLNSHYRAIMIVIRGVSCQMSGHVMSSYQISNSQLSDLVSIINMNSKQKFLLQPPSKNHFLSERLIWGAPTLRYPHSQHFLSFLHFSDIKISKKITSSYKHK